MLLKPIYTALLLLTLLPGTLFADVLSEGRAAIADKNHKKALELFSAAAEKGEAQGEYGMGVLYTEGWAVEKDAVKAFHWFRKAARQDYPPAQFNLGNAYFKGTGVEPSLPEAEIWWDLSARNGYSQAQYNLGMLLYNEAGSEEAKEQGIAWTRAAAKQSVEWAAKQLATIDEPINYTLISFDSTREPARSEAHIMTLPPDRYTIHLLSTKKLHSAINTIKQNALEGRAMIYRSPGTESWFGVIYGIYDSKREAEETIASMKPSLKKSGPTIRSINSIQEKIEKWRISQFSGQTATEP